MARPKGSKNKSNVVLPEEIIHQTPPEPQVVKDESRSGSYTYIGTPQPIEDEGVNSTVNSENSQESIKSEDMKKIEIKSDKKCQNQLLMDSSVRDEPVTIPGGEFYNLFD
jgi:hypothetical protein